jgi:hypothetical protein
MFSRLLNLSHCSSQDEKYEELYKVFHTDFVQNQTYLASAIYVNPAFQGFKDGKEKIFWHIVTRKNQATKIREYDEKRAERIEWVKRMILNHNHSEVKSFYYYEDNRKIRFYLWAYNHDFLVILQKLGATESYVVTSFYIDNDRKRDTTQRKYDEYIAKSDVKLNACEWF